MKKINQLLKISLSLTLMCFMSLTVLAQIKKQLA